MGPGKINCWILFIYMQKLQVDNLFAFCTSIIEKHITLDRSMPGPDHKSSLEPNELAALVSSVRNIENALGDGVKAPTEIESNTAQVARKSIVAQTEIKAGTLIEESMLAYKRPGTGIPPYKAADIIGKIAKCDIAENALLESDHY